MLRYLFAPLLLLFSLFGSTAAAAASPPTLSLSPNTPEILNNIYSGQFDAAIQEARQLQTKQPEYPLGYLLEDEAQWWKIWCASAEFKYGMTMARHRDKLASDQHYFDVAAKAYSLAEASLDRQKSAEMYLYAGMADALSARLYSLRGENRNVARVGVRARENFKTALQLDPSLADADLGLGLYNYYVDTLSAVARILRFFMGIPGGSKVEGIQQLQRAIREGQLTPAVARFYLALNLHNYDQKYADALQVLEPLAKQYPENPIFQLARGDLYAKIGKRQQAAAAYKAAVADAAKMPDEACHAKVDALVRQARAALAKPSKTPQPEEQADEE